MDKLNEQYYRVDFETAKLLKEAGFEVKCTAYYELVDKYYWGVVANNNHNFHPKRISAPLISVAYQWCRDKGYGHNYMGDLLFKRNKTGVSMLQNADTRENISFITACCTHLITHTN